MAKTDNLTDFVTDIANAIREKKGISNLINPQDFSSEILTITIGEEEEKIIEVQIPNEFYTSTSSIYYFQVTDDKILFSTNNNSDIGLWLYTISLNTFVQIYSRGYDWRYFQKINDKCLISSGTSNTRNSGVLIYDINNDSLHRASTYNYKWYIYTKINEEKWLITGGVGILLYNTTDNTIITLYNTGNLLYNSQITSTQWLFGSNGYVSYVVLYNSETDTAEEITIPVSTSVSNFHIIGNKCLMTGGATGILMYDITSKTVTQVSTIGNSYNSFKNINNKCLIGKTGSTAYLLLFDSETNTATQIYSTASNWVNFYLIGNKCLIGDDYSVGKGLLLYNSEDDSLTALTTTGQFVTFVQNNNKILTATKSSTNSGVFLYNDTDNTLTKKYSYGYRYDTYEFDGENCYISSSDLSVNRRILFYNNEDETVSLVAYKV